MTNSKSGFLALTVLSGVFAWRNRFAIQRKLESLGIRTPLLRGSIEESARSIASKVGGKMKRGATIAEDIISRKVG